MKVIAANSRANYNFTISNKIEAGIVLTGSEVKSLRTNTGSIRGAYIIEQNGELWLSNSFIKKYQNDYTSTWMQRYIYPNLNNSWYKAAINGGLIGLITYGTYAFTCQSLFKGWTWPITITDVIWGIVICAIVSVIGRAIQVAIG